MLSSGYRCGGSARSPWLTGLGHIFAVYREFTGNFANFLPKWPEFHDMCSDYWLDISGLYANSLFWSEQGIHPT